MHGMQATIHTTGDNQNHNLPDVKGANGRKRTVQ